MKQLRHGAAVTAANARQALQRLASHVPGMAEFAPDRSEPAFLQEFKQPCLEIEERPIGVSIYATFYMLCALLFLAVIWSFVGKLDRIVVGQGRVSGTDTVIALQPFAVSKIVAINVKPGDHVRKGDVLISFDPAFAKADELSLDAKVNELSAARDRMEAEMSGGTYEVSSTPTAAELIQQDIFLRRQAQLAAELSQRESIQGRLKAAIDAGQAAITNLERQVKLAHDVTAMRQKLFDMEYGSKINLIEAQQQELAAVEHLRDAKTDIATKSQQLAQAVAERESFVSEWRSKLNEELVTARQQAQEASDSLSKARRMSEFASLTAPVDGIVLEIADRSVGSVLKEAESLITLVPAGSPLQVEADIMSADVGYVEVNDPVRIKLEAYPFQKFGTLSGHLTVVSPDSITRDNGKDKSTRAVFHTVVQLDDDIDALAKRGIQLRPGLVSTAEITTGKRSIASYILYPIFGVFDESLREP